MLQNSSICPWCSSENPNKIGVKLTLKNDFRITCNMCGKEYAKTEKGIARINDSYKFFTPLKYAIILSLLFPIIGKFYGVDDIHLIVAFCLIISILFLTVAFEAILTGELPSQGPPLYRDLNPEFFSVGIALYFSVAALAAIVAFIMFFK